MAIGVGLIMLLYSSFDFAQMKEIMRSGVNYWWLIGMLVVSTFSHVFRAARWRLQLKALNILPSFSALVNSIFGTYAVNLVFPRLGEVWRSGYIASRERASFTTVFGSMVGDRLSDTITVLLLTVFTFLIAQDAFSTFLDTYPQIKDGLMGTLTSPFFSFSSSSSSPFMFLNVAITILLHVPFFSFLFLFLNIIKNSHLNQL